MNDKYATATGYLQGNLISLRHDRNLPNEFKQKLQNILDSAEAIVAEKTCETCGCWGGRGSEGETRKCYQRDVYSDTDLEHKHHFETCQGWVKRKGE